MRTRQTGQALPLHLVETSMESRDHRAHWIAAENIARFEHKLTNEKDTCERKMLEGLLVLEREKLKALNEGDP